MKGGKKIRIAFYLLAAGGAALFTALLIRQGAPHVIAAFASAGWWIAAVAIYHLFVPVFLDALAWWALFPKSERLSLWPLFAADPEAPVAVATVLDALDRRVSQHAGAFRYCWRRCR